MSALFSRAWWRAAGQRAARTALVVLAPLVPGLVNDPGGTWQRAASMLALSVVASLATSLAGLPELDGTGTSWWVAMLQRAARTAGQVLAAGIGTALLLQDVTWQALGLQVLSAVAGTVILAAISALPEAQPVAGLVDDAQPAGRHAA